MSLEIPDISLGRYGYEGKISLSAWDEYLTDSNGIDLDIGGDMVGNEPSIKEEHVAAYHSAIEKQYSIRNAIIGELYKKYPEMKMNYGYEAEEAKEFMPDIDNADRFKDLVGLVGVHIMNVFREGIAYVGYQFSCTWDEEHGLGVMTHKDRVVDLGSAEVSFLTWVAEEDLEKIKGSAPF